MCSAGSVWAFPQTGCPIRKSPDHHLLPTPRRLSQVAASFIGAWCLGIHLRPLVACPTYDHSSLLEGWIADIRASKRSPSAIRQESRFDLFGYQSAGGDDRTRTGDPLRAKQVLSQLSYIPGTRFEHDRDALSDDALSVRLPPHADL